MLIAQAVGQTDKAEQIVAQYDARVAEFKKKMGAGLKKTIVSVVSLTPQSESINALTKSSYPGIIMDQLGLQRPPSQALDNRIGYIISTELLSQIDGDVLFIGTFSFPTPTDAQKAFEQIKTEPLWSSLKVVQQGKVHLIGRYWIPGSYLTANRVLDDLEKYLLQQN